MNLQEAIDAPAWHIDHFPQSFWPRQTTLNRITVESRFPAATIEALRARGHEVRVGDDWSGPHVGLHTRARRQGRLVLRAGANARGMQGYAVGR
jgi:gamma-glutamyltranspeptidase/glutathione hydrolase